MVAITVEPTRCGTADTPNLTEPHSLPFSVTFYGQSLMNTTVVNGAVASAEGLNTITTLRQSLLSTIYIMLIALPGYWLAIVFVARMGRYRMVSGPAGAPLLPAHALPRPCARRTWDSYSPPCGLPC